MGTSHLYADALAGPKRLAVNVRRGLGGRWAQRKGDSFTKAYAVNLSHRLPLLYLVVVFNCVLMALRFQSLTPVWIWLFGPVAIGGFAIWRAYY